MIARVTRPREPPPPDTEEQTAPKTAKQQKQDEQNVERVNRYNARKRDGLSVYSIVAPDNDLENHLVRTGRLKEWETTDKRKVTAGLQDCVNDLIKS